MLRGRYGYFQTTGNLLQVAADNSESPYPLPKPRPTAWNVELGVRLRVARLARNLSQQAVAGHLNRSFQMIQRLEYGTARLLAEDAITLANLYRVDIKTLLGIAAHKGNHAVEKSTPKIRQK